MKTRDIAIDLDVAASYPGRSPFHPDQSYPEFGGRFGSDFSPDNKIYASVRQLLNELGYDSDNRETPQWNPFGEFIRPGDRVLIKPNLVLHHNDGDDDITAVVTHASVIRPLVDYALIALKGSGSIVIGDAPHGDADFDRIVRANGLLDLTGWYADRGEPVELRDFRKIIYPDGFTNSTWREVAGDPEGYVSVDLGERSHLCGLANLDQLYGSDYDRQQIVQEHSGGRHRYLVSGTVLRSDVIICVPKLKTHKKTGVTINLKNLVGINGDKNFLAHYRVGSPSEGGDEYPDSTNPIVNLLRRWDHWSKDKLLAPNRLLCRYIYRIANLPFQALRRLYCLVSRETLCHGGNWYGNDTCWRMCLDLNWILRHVSIAGRLDERQQHRYFCLVDGIVAGEGSGPMTPDPKPCGLLAAGRNPYQLDYICTYLMGFDPERLALLREARKDHEAGFVVDDLRISCRRGENQLDYRSVNLAFEPHPAWKGTLERDS